MARVCYDRRHFLKTIGLGAAAVALPGNRCAVAETDPGKPNFVIIFTDDQGYQDAGCFNAPLLETPNLDRMAEEGMKFTDFYSAAPSCTPSRAALMTGCYPNRVSLPHVLNPRSSIGINSNEVTVAELLKAQGYATACYGKWHLGHHPQFLPTRHGFDDYFGLPYSNDMWPRHPSNKTFPELPLIEGEKVIELNPDQRMLTTWYTERAVRFIEKNQDRPFFLYVPHSMPHVPLHVSDKFKGKSKQGLYGDVIMEIDWSVGQILSTLKRLSLDKKTLVVFTSDNGPWLSYGDHAGSAKPLREGKGTTFDGGQREPCIMWWPGRIPAASVCGELCGTIDVLPTFARLAGAQVPTDRVIDGRDIWPLMSGQSGAKSPHEAFFFHRGGRLQAVRSGPWKLHLTHDYRCLETPGSGGKPGKYVNKKIEQSLFNLEEDIAEQHDVSADHPEVVERLLALLDNFRKDIKANSRPPGRVAKQG